MVFHQKYLMYHWSKKAESILEDLVNFFGYVYWDFLYTHVYWLFILYRRGYSKKLINPKQTDTVRFVFTKIFFLRKKKLVVFQPVNSIERPVFAFLPIRPFISKYRINSKMKCLLIFGFNNQPLLMLSSSIHWKQIMSSIPPAE